MKKKFYFQCRTCGHTIGSFAEWFALGQKCSQCGESKINTIYLTPENKLKDLINKNERPDSLWHYFDFLPLNNRKNIISDGEGISPIHRWEFMEEYAYCKYKLNLKVYINRNDYSPATGTFKDKGGSLAASVLKENGIKEYVVASTGNTANAFVNTFGKKTGNFLRTIFYCHKDGFWEKNFIHHKVLWGQKVI